MTSPNDTPKYIDIIFDLLEQQYAYQSVMVPLAMYLHGKLHGADVLVEGAEEELFKQIVDKVLKAEQIDAAHGRTTFLTDLIRHHDKTPT